MVQAVHEVDHLKQLLVVVSPSNQMKMAAGFQEAALMGGLWPDMQSLNLIFSHGFAEDVTNFTEAVMGNRFPDLTRVMVRGSVLSFPLEELLMANSSVKFVDVSHLTLHTRNFGLPDMQELEVFVYDATWGEFPMLCSLPNLRTVVLFGRVIEVVWDHSYADARVLRFLSRGIHQMCWRKAVNSASCHTMVSVVKNYLSLLPF